MALQEEQSEQPQSRWLSHYSRERRDLSASVEDALIVSQDQQWEEEENEVGRLMRSKQKRSLIPPRLSLQSKKVPAVRAGEFVGSIAEIQPEVVSKSSEIPKSAANMPRANLLARVAQRITTSLVAFGATTYPEDFLALPVSLFEEPQFLSAQHELSLLPPPISQDGVMESVQSTAPFVRIPDSLAGMPFESVPPMVQFNHTIMPSTPGTRAMRLAGHTAKIHLQTASIPAAPKPDEQQSIDAPMLESAWIASEIYAMYENDMISMAAMDVPAKEMGTTSNHLPAIEMFRRDEGTTSVHLPVVEKLQGSIHNAMPSAFFGSGTIESGQCDISVADAHTISTSVVTVTLTSNPGPVVVQYISLRPYIGFTLHLTAPAVASTTFNYAILQSGL